MGFASKFNRNRKFTADTSGFQYAAMADLYNNNGKDFVYPLRAIYVNTKSKFGDAPVFATDTCFVNGPAYMLDTVRDILADDEAVDAINAGKVGFTIYPYVNDRFKRDCFGINFVDIE